MDGLSIHELAAGVAAGNLLTLAFFYALREAVLKEHQGKDPRILSYIGIIGPMLWLGAVFYVNATT